MKRICQIILLFISSHYFQGFSQFPEGEVIRTWRTLAIRDVNTAFTYENIQGSPYYTKDFISGTVFLKNGTYANVPIRYDCYQDEIEFNQENKIQWLDKKEVRNIRSGSEILIVTSLNEDTSKLGYFFLLGTGKYTLLVRKRVGYHPYIPAKGYASSVPERFEREKDEFYLKVKGFPAKKFNSRKNLLTLLNDSSIAREYINKEKIKYNDAEDLKKLINYLNSQ